MNYLDSEKQKAAVEAACKKEATQTAENIEIARKKAEDLTNQLHEAEQNERNQLQEQDVAQRLINEAAGMLSAAVKTGHIQTAKVAQVMLDSGNDKLNEAMKQLANVRACKEKLEGKLMKAQSTLTGLTRKSKQYRCRPHWTFWKKDLNTNNPDMSGYAGKFNSVLLCPRDWRPCLCEPDLSVQSTNCNKVLLCYVYVCVVLKLSLNLYFLVSLKIFTVGGLTIVCYKKISLWKLER